MKRLLVCSGLIVLFQFSLSAQSRSEVDVLLSVQPMVHLHLVDSVDQILESDGIHQQGSSGHEIQGVLFETRYDFKNALNAYLEAFGGTDQHNDPVTYCRLAGRVGHVLSLMRESQLAHEHFEKALQITDHSWLPWVLYWSAQHQQNEGIIGAALNQYQDAIQGFSSTGQIVPASQIAFTLGAMQAKLANWDLAEQYFLTASDLTRQLQDPASMARIDQALAWMYLDMGEWALANEYAQNGMASVGSDDVVMRARLSLILVASEHRGKFSEDDIRKAQELLEQQQIYLPGMESFYLEKAILFERSNQANDALLARKQYDIFRDSAWIQQKSAQADQLVMRFKSELQVGEKEAQIAQLESNQRYIRIIIWLLSGLILALLGLISAMYFRYRQKRKDHQILIERNQIIEEQHHQIVDKNAELESLNERLISEIADREYLEHSQEQNAHYLAALSQELRNPLQAIQGISGELLMENDLDPYQNELKKIRSATQDIVQYLNDLLDKARLESGKISFTSEAFDPAQTIEEVLARFQDLAQRRSVSLQLERNPRLDSPLVGDVIRLTQILSNLLKIVFQQEDLKAITLTVRTRDGESAESRILDLDIASDGRVRDPELLREVLTDSLANKGSIRGAYYNGHTGLLLSRRLVELQQGMILLETQANATHIRIWLPYRTNVDQSSGGAELPDGTFLAGRQILLAEDNRLNQWVVGKILEEHGATVTICDDGAQAVEAFGKGVYDLVIMDLQMPELDGYRATQSIKKMAASSGRSIPILAMTASAYVISSDKASMFSMDDYIGKPFDRNVLLGKAIGLISRTVQA